MEKIWDDSKIYDSDDDEQAPEDLIYFSDGDDEFETEDESEMSENDKQDHIQWAFSMLDYLINKWKQKRIGTPPSNWKEILIKLLDLENFQNVDRNEDFERFRDDFKEDYDEQEVVPLSTRGGWFPDVKPIGLRGGSGHARLQQASHLKLSNNKNINKNLGV